MTLIKDCLKTLKEKNETTKLKSLMKFANEQTNESENITEEDLTELEIYVSSLRRQMVYIRDSDYGDLRDMLNILGIPFKTAPNEASVPKIKMMFANKAISATIPAFP